MKKLRFLTVLALMLAVLIGANSALACTIFLVGKDASADGSTMATHNDDSTGADFRLWIIPSMEGGEGIKRDLVMDSHNYGDFGDYPNTKDYGNGTLINEMDQPEDTYAYLHSRYSFINEAGVAMGESTFSYDDAAYEPDGVFTLLFDKNTGIIDCWNAQDIALERASTAREAVEIMGKLCEEYGWYDYGETMDICDGEETYIFEAYGQDLWAAVKMPADAFFVSANRARIAEFDFDDPENYLCSPNLKSFAIENGLWSEESGEPFSPAEIYAPCTSDYCTLREWRALDLVAPSLGLQPNQDRYPLYVIPEKKLSVRDIFELAGDYYEGTDFDVSRTAYGGDFGNPLNFNTKYRTINMYRTCYLMLANIKGWLPDEIKCLVWYGYGAPDSTFITPLWASQSELPSYYDHGSRYEKFDRTSGWWINTYVQDMASRYYDLAIEKIEAVRDERLDALIEEVAAKQEDWAARIETEHDAVMEELTKFACDTANAWFEDWLDLGDTLVSDFVWNRVNADGRISGGGYSDWYKEIMENAPMKPVEEPEA